MLNDEQCWNSVLNKDKSQDGVFFFGVKTTGVYCRPSCPARIPLRKNVVFYENRADAEKDGLRACLRCRPNAVAEAEANKLRIRRLSEYIRQHCQSGESLKLNDLAMQVGISPFHLQRTFKAVMGLTPKEYVEACRVNALKEELRRNESVTAAVYESGFGSSRAVYDRSNSRIGMKPSEYRAGGSGVEISYVTIESPLGLLMLAATERGLCFLQFGASREELLNELRREFPKASLEEMQEPYSEQFKLWMASLGRYLRREQIRLDLPVDVKGSAFQEKVWRYLQSIPPGEMYSYGQVAKAIGSPNAVRAVANACAANKVAIAIPCHRVIRGDGALGGYKWGMKRKNSLLEGERTAKASAG